MKCFKIKGCGINNPAPFFIVLLFAVSFLISGEAVADRHVKALWIVRDSISTLAKAEEAVNFAASRGYKDIFVQVRGRGDAFYKSSFVPGPVEYPTIPDFYDPLDNVIKLAHKHGLRVHAWFNMFLTWSSDKNPENIRHPLKSHEDWFMVSLDGMKMGKCPIDSIRCRNIEGRYLSPAYSEVCNFLVRIVTEVILKYDVDGVHLDYIRYPGRDYDFNDTVRSDYKKKERIDPVDIVKSNSVDSESIRQFEKWQDYRASLVTEQVRLISERVKKSGRKISLSAAVKPDINEAFSEYGQDWGKWINGGLIDFVAIMSYYSDSNKVRDSVKTALRTVDKERILVGVGLFKLSPEETAEQLEIVNEFGLKGFSVFSYKVLEDNKDLSDTVDAFKPVFRGKLIEGDKTR